MFTCITLVLQKATSGVPERGIQLSDSVHRYSSFRTISFLETVERRSNSPSSYMFFICLLTAGTFKLRGDGESGIATGKATNGCG